METYSSTEVATLLGVKHNLILEWVNSGYLRAVKSTSDKTKINRLRFCKNDVYNFIASYPYLLSQNVIKLSVRRE